MENCASSIRPEDEPVEEVKKVHPPEAASSGAAALVVVPPEPKAVAKKRGRPPKRASSRANRKEGCGSSKERTSASNTPDSTS